MREAGALGCEPSRWLVCFWRETSVPWFDRWFPGRYRHVSAFGYCDVPKAWVFVEPAIGGTRVMVELDGPRAQALIEQWMAGSDVLVVDKGPDRPPLWTMLLGWCVPAVARIIGRGHGALRPDALWRHLLPYAVEVFAHEDERAQAGPGPGGAAAAGAERPDCVTAG